MKISPSPVMEALLATTEDPAAVCTPIRGRDYRYKVTPQSNAGLTPCSQVQPESLVARNVALLGMMLTMVKRWPALFAGVPKEELVTVCLFAEFGKIGSYEPNNEYGQQRGYFWEYDKDFRPYPQSEQTLLGLLNGIAVPYQVQLGLRLVGLEDEESIGRYAQYTKPWVAMAIGFANSLKQDGVNVFDLAQDVVNTYKLETTLFAPYVTTNA